MMDDTPSTTSPPVPLPGHRFLVPILAAWVAVLAVATGVGWLVADRAQARARESALAHEHAETVEVVRRLADVLVRHRLRALVDADLAALDRYERQVRDGRLGAEEARRQVGEFLREQRIGAGGGLFVVDADMRPVVQPDEELPATQALTNAGAWLEWDPEATGYQEKSWRRPGRMSGRTMALYNAYYAPWDWMLVAACPKDDALRMISVDEVNRLLSADERWECFVLAYDPGPPPTLIDTDRSQARDAHGELVYSRLLDDKTGRLQYDWRADPESTVEKRVLYYAHLPGVPWVVATEASLDATSQAAGGGFMPTLLWFEAVLTVCVVLWAGWTVWGARRSVQASTHRVEKRLNQRSEALNQELETTRTDLRTARETVERLEKKNRELSTWLEELKESRHEVQVVNDLSDLLQACQTQAETDNVILQMGRELFGHDSGVLARYYEEQNVLEVTVSWGDPQIAQEDFQLDDCWALRRGKVYDVEGPDPELLCGHLSEPPDHGYLCLPLVAQGELLGLLHLQWGAPDPGLGEEALEEHRQSRRRLASMVTEQFALALANLKLREMLREQSIRDQLTGLYNRRYMEEALRREIHRAGRHEAPMGLVMIDVDHFKSFNDTHGHEAGDDLLKALGEMLQANVRQEDIACRYGGEEFLVILPEAGLDIVRQRAESIRTKAESQLRVKKQKVTISAGIAVYPDSGRSVDTLLGAADEALYEAKEQGRNRVMVWQPGADSEPS